MPEAIRARIFAACPDLRGALPAVAATVIGVGAGPGRALGAEFLRQSVFSGMQLERHEIAVLALMLGVISFAVVTAVLLVRARVRAAQAAITARTQINRLRDEVDRAHALLLSEPQVIVVWTPGEEPLVIGDIGSIGSASWPQSVLAFETWLDTERAQMMQHAVQALRSHGDGFAVTLVTLAGRCMEADGRAVGARAVLRLKDVSGTKRELVDLAARFDELKRDVDTIRTLVETLPAPIWARDAEGRMAWVNSTYARAVEARDSTDAVARKLELLGPAARQDLARARGAGQTYSARVPIIVAGARRIFDVLEVPTRNGGAGFGIDVTEVEGMRNEVAHTIEAHRRILDQLPTAVAMFDAGRRLTFHNAAYRVLWGLSAAFLDQGPTESAVLDQLRAARKLPEQADFRTWKAQLHEAYRSVEAREHLWHLPDGRTVRAVTTSNPEGGVTYLFDDVTERLDLKRRYDSLARVQGETLDNLSEAVAVFASDGRLRLSNPAFARLWRLPSALLADRPHVESVIAACRPSHGEAATWEALRGAVTGLESREAIAGRIERSDGSVVDCATLPLPDGATLVTFQDVTDTVNVERALREKNDALETAYALKNNFVHLVSYELRSPLTNIIGFAQLLEDGTAGPLTDKQSEYLDYISSSSSVLLAIINDILDLATIDAGVMTLDLGPVDIRATMDAAVDAVRERLNEGSLTLEIDADPNIGSFVADARRVRQVLYNLLANAIGFSPADEKITLTAERCNEVVVFRVTDRGPGIPVEMQARVFDRFETHGLGSRHRGTGLGLSIVRSLVELHGGTVALDSAVGRGTTVACLFPLDRVVEQQAAE
jgi:signal transduction histidine kinase